MKNYKYYRELSQLPPLIKNLVIGEVYPEDTVLDLYEKHATEKSTLTIAEYILMMPDQTYFTRVSNSVKEAFDELMDKCVDMVNEPPHYKNDKSGVECIEITRHRNFNIGNAIKYLWRSGLKQDSDKSIKAKEIEDLKKAIFYINDEIKRIENE